MACTKIKHQWFRASPACPSGSKPSSLQSRLLSPAAGRGLLPIDNRVARRLIGLPALTRFGNGGLIAAVEQLEAALVVADPLGASTVGDEQEGGAVGILVEMGEPDRLALGLAVRSEAHKSELQ